VELSFIQLSAFASNWKRMKLGDDDLRSLESAIAEAPGRAPVMSGTGGLRKIRFATQFGSGKSGGARVCYAYFADFHLVYLCAVFPKNEKARHCLTDHVNARRYNTVIPSVSIAR
jgi:hypothetical protein